MARDHSCGSCMDEGCLELTVAQLRLSWQSQSDRVADLTNENIILKAEVERLKHPDSLCKTFIKCSYCAVRDSEVQRNLDLIRAGEEHEKIEYERDAMLDELALSVQENEKLRETIKIMKEQFVLLGVPAP